MNDFDDNDDCGIWVDDPTFDFETLFKVLAELSDFSEKRIDKLKQDFESNNVLRFQESANLEFFRSCAVYHDFLNRRNSFSNPSKLLQHFVSLTDTVNASQSQYDSWELCFPTLQRQEQQAFLEEAITTIKYYYGEYKKQLLKERGRMETILSQLYMFQDGEFINYVNFEVKKLSYGNCKQFLEDLEARVSKLNAMYIQEDLDFITLPESDMIWYTERSNCGIAPILSITKHLDTLGSHLKELKFRLSCKIPLNDGDIDLITNLVNDLKDKHHIKFINEKYFLQSRFYTISYARWMDKEMTKIVVPRKSDLSAIIVVILKTFSNLTHQPTKVEVNNWIACLLEDYSQEFKRNTIRLLNCDKKSSRKPLTN